MFCCSYPLIGTSCVCISMQVYCHPGNVLNSLQEKKLLKRRSEELMVMNTNKLRSGIVICGAL